jgi:hypothetical protein
MASIAQGNPEVYDIVRDDSFVGSRYSAYYRFGLATLIPKNEQIPGVEFDAAVGICTCAERAA